MEVHGSADVLLMRLKHRVVMDGTGQDLYSCKSVLEFLMIMYDVLEGAFSFIPFLCTAANLGTVLKHIHETHGVLHRDISPGNILRRSVANTVPVQDSLKFAADIVSTKYQDVRYAFPCRVKVVLTMVTALARGVLSSISTTRSGMGIHVKVLLILLWYASLPLHWLVSHDALEGHTVIHRQECQHSFQI